MYRYASLGCFALIFLSTLSTLTHSQSGEIHDRVQDKLVALEVVGKDKNSGAPISEVGTGFVIDPDGWVLTAAHLYDDLVARGAIEATLTTSAHLGDMTTAAIEATGLQKNNYDVALLKLARRVGAYPQVRSLCAANFNYKKLKIYTSGFYYSCETYDPSGATCLTRKVRYSSGSGEIRSLDTPLTYAWETSLNFSDGNSGSPVYLENGLVIGIAKGIIKSGNNLNVFVPISFANNLIQNIPGAQVCVDLNTCVNNRVAQSATEKFTVSGGARAPGTGPQLGSVYETDNVCYSAPPGYSIDGQVLVRDDGNNGGRGSISPVSYSVDAKNNTVKACVNLRAWSEPIPFGAGGWQYVTLSGLIRKSELDVTQADARDYCASTVR